MVEAQIRGALDYLTYDRSEAWRRRERFILLGVVRSIRKDNAVASSRLVEAMLSSGLKFENFSPLEAAKEANSKYEALNSWKYIPKRGAKVIQAGKFSSEVINRDEIPTEYATLIERYRIFEQNEKLRKEQKNG